jgi:hypothetical protein
MTVLTDPCQCDFESFGQLLVRRREKEPYARFRRVQEAIGRSECCRDYKIVSINIESVEGMRPSIEKVNVMFGALATELRVRGSQWFMHPSVVDRRVSTVSVACLFPISSILLCMLLMCKPSWPGNLARLVKENWSCEHSDHSRVLLWVALVSLKEVCGRSVPLVSFDCDRLDQMKQELIDCALSTSAKYEGVSCSVPCVRRSASRGHIVASLAVAKIVTCAKRKRRRGGIFQTMVDFCRSACDHSMAYRHDEFRVTDRTVTAPKYKSNRVSKTLAWAEFASRLEAKLEGCTNPVWSTSQWQTRFERRVYLHERNQDLQDEFQNLWTAV